jgi:hypothetical protein
MSTKVVFITCAIAVSKKRNFRCYDIPSAFVNIDVDKDVLMVLKGELTEMMIQIAPQTYRTYFTVDKKRNPVLHVKLQKALYGLMRASLWFYRKLRKELEQYKFEVNPYDPCMANITTGCREQMIMIWQVNNLMSLSTDDFELTKFSCYLAKIYGLKLSMDTRNRHNYLGIDLKFNEDGTLDVSMVQECDCRVPRHDHRKGSNAIS